MQNPIVNIYPNPFSVYEKDTFILNVGDSLLDLLQQKYPTGFNLPTVIKLNRKKLPVENYDIVLNENDIVDIGIQPLLGGDEDQDFITRLFQTAEEALGSAVTKVGEFIFGKPVLDTPEDLTSSTPERGNAYRLRPQSNLSRLGEPIPTQYGTFKVYPDLAASPWVENTNNEQFLNQLFTLGWGEFDIQQIKLGDMTLDTFEGLQYRVYGPNEAVTLFHDNMYTIPAFDNFNIIQARSFSRWNIGYSFVFDKPNKKITGPTGSGFNEFVDAGDTVLIAPVSTYGFAGEFEVNSVSDTEIVFNDVATWPGSDTDPGTVFLYPKKRVSYLAFGNTDLDFPVSVSSRTIFTDTTIGYVTNPINTAVNTFYVDIVFPHGLYMESGGVYSNYTASFTIIAKQLNDDGTYAGTVTSVTGSSMSSESGDNITWHPTQSQERRWDPNATFTIYDNGVAIPSGDISSIEYGGGFGGAKVTFTGTKTGPITYNGSYILTRTFQKPLSVTGSTTDILRTTLVYDMSSLYQWVDGRFEIYIYRTDAYDWANTSIQSNANITSVKSKLTAVSKFGPYTMLAIRLNALQDLQGATTKKINLIATRKLKTWTGSAWTGLTPTRSIAWALADIWMSTYGASRPQANIDLATLSTLDTLWTSRGDTFDGIFDSNITVWEALTKVARTGRCRPVFDGTTLTFVRDGVQSLYTAMFTPDNILPGSFNINYSFPDDQTPNGVQITYLDEDNNHSPAIVESTPGLNNPQKINFFGCVNYAQAWRESQYLAAQIVKQRVTVSFATEMSGHIPFYGDLISVHYDLPSWGQGGQVTCKSGTTITTSQPLDWTGSEPFYMSFMRPDGSLSGPHTVTQGSNDKQAILSSDVTDFTFITTLNNQNLTIYQFGPSTNWNKPCLVTSVKPRGDNETVNITCIPYDGSIHTADQSTPPSKPSTTPTGDPTPPGIAGLTLSNVPLSGSVVAVWNPENNITSYKYQKSTDNVTYTDVSTPTTPTETISATGVLYIRVACVVGSTVGTYTQRVIVAT